jgi:hypothetical protein
MPLSSIFQLYHGDQFEWWKKPEYLERTTDHGHRYSSLNHIDGVMVNVLASSVVDCGFEPWLGQTKDYKIGIYCFSAKHAALRRKSKYWWARNQDNVSKWGDMSIHRLLFQ